MDKKTKITLQIIVLIIAGVSLLFYLTNPFGAKKESEDNLEFPEMPQVYFIPSVNLGPSLVKEYQSRFQKTVEAINHNPNDLSLWLTLGSLMKAIKSYDQAEKVWLYTTKRWPSDPVAFGNLADLYTNFQKDYSKAEWAWKAAVEKSKNSTEALIYYRNLHEFYRYHYQEKADLADDILLEAIEKYPAEPDFIALLAVYYRDKGDKEKAIEYFEKLLELDPDNSAARRDLEELQQPKVVP